MRWIEERVSSGNWANVADVYHVNGTRSQSVRGEAETFPVILLDMCYFWWCDVNVSRRKSSAVMT